MLKSEGNARFYESKDVWWGKLSSWYKKYEFYEKFYKYFYILIWLLQEGTYVNKDEL